MADQLVTIAQVKARLFPAGSADTTDDTLITELVEEVSDYIQHNTKRRFLPITSATYTVDTIAGYVLRFPWGIRTLTTLAVNISAHQPDTGGTYTTITNFGLRPSVVDLPVGWPATEIVLLGLSTATITAFANIRNGAQITCTAGFATVPPDIQAVAIDGTVSAYQMRKNGTSGVFGVDDASGVPWWQFTRTSWKTLSMYSYPGVA